MRKKKFSLKKAVWYACLSAALLFLFLIGAAIAVTSDLPSVTQLTSGKISQSTKIYDRTGQILLYEISDSGETRTIVPFSQMPQYLKDATISIEDENFYNEPAFDWRGIARAALVNLTRGGIFQGGSTITQQLARNAFLKPERTFLRKIKELVLAIKLDENYSKDEILGLYLNQIPYGPTIYGVEAASRAYFGKGVQDINLAEAAILAALPKAPTYYSPWGSRLKDLFKRQKIVLEKMYELGKISKKELDEAVAYNVSFQPKSIGGIKAPHFVMAVEDYLVQKYGENMVNRGGLRVITTLDWNLQEIAEKTVYDGAKRNEELYQGKNAALVAQDAGTGQILAMVGSRDYFDKDVDGNFNVATQGLRQPGSALKPFAYLTLFQKGYSPDSVLFDVPTEFASKNPSCPAIVDFNNENTECFHPQNFSNTFSGPITLRNALAQSVNLPAVKVLYLAGIQNVLDNLHKFGITTLNEPNRYGLSLVLGGGEVKLFDLVGAYSVLANEGVKRQQSLVLEVRDGNGNTIESYEDKKEVVADAQSVRLVNDILSDVEARSGLFRGGLSLTVFPEYDVALKTGTTQDYRDAWAIGYTPTFVVGVWAGNSDNTKMQKNAGSILAAVPIWNKFMTEALKSQPKQTFNRPDAVPEDKPMLNGDYFYNNQLHSILYYADKSDPLGPQPLDPSRDPQFENWETGVLEWAKNNVGVVSSYSQITPGQSGPGLQLSSLPVVKIRNPQQGGFVGSQISVAADIVSYFNVGKINVYFNNQNVGSFTGSFGKNYTLNWSFTAYALLPQNSLVVEVFDEKNQRSQDEVIVYQ